MTPCQISSASCANLACALKGFAGTCFARLWVSIIHWELAREPYDPPQLHINQDIKSLEDLETWVTLDDFEVTGYRHHDPIAYPFSV